MPPHDAELISEQIHPVPGTADTAAMAAGAPGLPRKFTWRDHEYEVAEILKTWKATGECWSGSGERYIRKHFFLIRTTSGHEMTIYFERQARSRAQRKARWWLYTVKSPAA